MIDEKGYSDLPFLVLIDFETNKSEQLCNIIFKTLFNYFREMG